MCQPSNDLNFTCLAFSQAQLEVTPKTVQAKKVEINFWGIPEQKILKGGYIKLRAPEEIYTYTTDLTCFDVRD